jgi:phosphoglycolate phosphatase-like HAD superfamily hydrolase
MIRYQVFIITRAAALPAMNGRDAQKPRRFKHVFLDAEGTLYVPKGKRLLWEFWANPSPEAAVEFFELDSGVVETLKTLRDQVDTLCLVSRNSWPILSAILKKYGIEKSFDEIILNGDKGKKIERYLAKHGLSKDESVMVGDMPALDLFPVLKAGIDAVLVDRWYNRMVRAERIKGLSELPAWLRIADIADGIGKNRVRIASLDEFEHQGDHDRAPSSVAATKRLIAVSGA